jgi:flagellar hook assembly protein FlgD
MKTLRNTLVFQFSLCCIFLFASGVIAEASSLATDGTVTFSVQTVTNGATYSPKNVLAIWVKDAQGNFVISRKVMAANRKQHLVKWVASSNNNVVNATTGATLPNHQTHNISWDCRDVNGNLVPDGTYEIWVEFTERNSNSGGAVGPSTKIAFNKGTEIVSLSPADESYFKNMVLNYTPVGNDLSTKLEFAAFPNPFNKNLNVTFQLIEPGFVNISAYDLNGKRLTELVNEVLPQGVNSITWEGKTENGQRLNPGIYFLRIINQGKMFMHKVVITN